MGRFGGPISDPTDLTPALPSRVVLTNQKCTFAADSISKNGHGRHRAAGDTTDFGIPASGPYATQ